MGIIVLLFAVIIVLLSAHLISAVAYKKLVLVTPKWAWPVRILIFISVAMVLAAACLFIFFLSVPFER
jgi:hypothetical protein